MRVLFVLCIAVTVQSAKLPSNSSSKLENDASTPAAITTNSLPITASVTTTTALPEVVTTETSVAFQHDCADPHNVNVACSVYKVDCDFEPFELVDEGSEPPEPHDLRIQSFSKSLARLSGKHQLHVDVSWQMPPKNDSLFLQAFKLEVKEVDSGRLNCFLFNVTEFELNKDRASPRFHFSSDSLFNFEKKYMVSLASLPPSAKMNKIVQEKTMPNDPENEIEDPENMTQYCLTHSHVEASKWTSGFRRIFLQSLTRTIQVVFVGAPPQYCYEEYEVRLLDGTGIELLHHAIVKATDMKEEVIDGRTITFGEYNFTDLELEVDYIPSVIPVEMSHDGRCLCPTSAQHGACSCVAADWKKVRLHKIEPPSTVNITQPPIEKPTQNEHRSSWTYFVMLFLSAFGILACFVCALVVFIRKYSTTKGKPARIRFISDNANGGQVSSTDTPLIYNKNTSILIIYSHDCPLHQEAVLAFADLLKNVFAFDVQIDEWNSREIEENLAEYINASIVRADKIVVINSVGAYHRVTSRQLEDGIIARKNAGLLDSIFDRQIDLALQHARVVSIRFSYTPTSYTLFALTPLLQYTVPQNMGLLIASLNDSSLKTDPRLSGYTPELSRLNAAITRMSQFVSTEPKWFESFHHRIPMSAQPCISSSLDSGFETCSHNVPNKETNQIEIAPKLSTTDESALLIPNEEPMEVIPLDCNKPEISQGDSAFYSSPFETEEMPTPQISDRPRIQEPYDKYEKHGESDDSGIMNTIDSAFMTSVN